MTIFWTPGDNRMVPMKEGLSGRPEVFLELDHSFFFLNFGIMLEIYNELVRGRKGFLLNIFFPSTRVQNKIF